MMWRRATVVVLLLIGLLVALGGQPVDGRKRKRPDRRSHSQYFYGAPTTGKCGYDGCPSTKAGMLNVHLVPHTHDDVGWLKTVDQYYYGTRARITQVSVKNILDSVVVSLLADPQRRFIYVESAFFFKWWREQSAERQQLVRELVDQGRLEFIGGAWSMNDEAAVHYQSTVDQFTWGLRRLNDTFGECGRPRVGWQIDPFGHSREQASLFAQMGYDGLFLGRVDYQDKAARLRDRRAEMIWRASANLAPGVADLFTGVLYNNYGPPPGFCFDVLCNDEPIVDAKRSKENNVERRVSDFIKYVEEQATHYRTDNVIITMGEDFTYTDASVWYKNIDKLILYANQRQANGSLVNLIYSTPSCYLKSLHDADLTWTTKSDDFFPYASDPHAYWTGYFTSRPTLKRFERQGNHFLQVCKQLSVLAPHRTSRSFDFHLNFLRETMGVMQHHDAVTGTEKQHVAEDYARLLTIALRACGETVRNVLNQLTTGHPAEPSGESATAAAADEPEDAHPWPHYDFAFDTCYTLNISECATSETAVRFMVTVYNPLAHSVQQYVRIPVPDALYTVRDYRDVLVESLAVPIASAVRQIHYRRSAAAYELVFAAAELPPLGYKSYFVARREPDVQQMMMQSDQPFDGDAAESAGGAAAGEPFNIGNQHVRLYFSAAGQLEAIESNGANASLRQTFFYYASANGNNVDFENRSSGAYIFRPAANGAEHLLSGDVRVQVVRTALVEEVQQTFGDWLSQVVRVYRDEQHVEFEWLCGGIPIEDGLGKEIVTRFSTDLRTDGVFFTDSNGREMLRRKRNVRDTWNVTIAEPAAGNYYPVTARIAIEEEGRRLAVLNDRAQGGSSLLDGAIDVMIHRRTLHDDAFGVGEALNETAFGGGLIARGHLYLTFGSTTSAKPNIQAQERFLQHKTLLPAWVFVSDATNYTFRDWREKFTNIYSGVSLSLPQNVNLLTLEPWRDGTILVRFEHLLERTEDPEIYSKAVHFNLQDVLDGLRVIELRETTLAANQWLSEAKRLHFNAANETADSYQVVSDASSYIVGRRAPFAVADNQADPFDIVLQPMQIRTFVLTLEQSV